MDVRNTPVVPIVALLAAALLTAAAALTRAAGQIALSEREIGLAAWAFPRAAVAADRGRPGRNHRRRRLVHRADRPAVRGRL